MSTIVIVDIIAIRNKKSLSDGQKQYQQKEMD